MADAWAAGKGLILVGGTCWQDWAITVDAHIVQNDTADYCWSTTSAPHVTITDPLHELAAQHLDPIEAELGNRRNTSVASTPVSSAITSFVTPAFSVVAAVSVTATGPSDGQGAVSGNRVEPVSRRMTTTVTV